MKLLVFGSTGGTGRELVRQALSQGHEVTAFARDTTKLELDHDRVTVVPGDVTDAAAVRGAVPGHDAVLCALGAPALVRTTVRTDGTRNIVAAMEDAGVRRLVCQSSLGVGDSLAVPMPRYVRLVFPLVLRRAFADHEGQEHLIRQSRLDWTIVRPTKMVDGERTGAYRHGLTDTTEKVKVKVSRADVADFMLRQLTDDSYLRLAPWVSD
jgi:putative NADH-flavin reductase